MVCPAIRFFVFLRKLPKMSDRSQSLPGIRPEVPLARINSGTTREERFQNTTLRPIVKLQSPLVLAAFAQYIVKHKCAFYPLSVERKMIFVEHTVQRDTKFRNLLKGMVIGHFTLDEYHRYLQNPNSFNKRIIGLFVELIKDNLQFFVQDEATVFS